MSYIDELDILNLACYITDIKLENGEDYNITKIEERLKEHYNTDLVGFKKLVYKFIDLIVISKIYTENKIYKGIYTENKIYKGFGNNEKFFCKLEVELGLKK